MKYKKKESEEERRCLVRRVTKRETSASIPIDEDKVAFELTSFSHRQDECLKRQCKDSNRNRRKF